MATIIATLLLIGTAASPQTTIEHEHVPSTIESSALVAAEESLVLDAMTTLNFKTYWWRMRESNPILGEHPSDLKVFGYFALTMVGTGALWKVLPPKARPLLYVVAAVEAYWFVYNRTQLQVSQDTIDAGVRIRNGPRLVNVNAPAPPSYWPFPGQSRGREQAFMVAFAF